MLHYQFGLEIKDDFVQTFIKKALIPFLIIQAITLILLTSINYIPPHEKGLLQDSSSSEFELLEPGLYIRAPWPFMAWAQPFPTSP